MMSSAIDRRAHVPQAGDQPADDVAAPRPLADRRQAPIVDVDDDDAAAGRFRAGRSQQDVVDRVVEAGEKRGAKHPEHSRDQHGNDAAQKNQTATRGAPCALAIARGYLTVISTRRLRGSGVSLGVLTSRSASPCDVTSMVGGVEARLDEDIADGHRPLQPEREVRPRRPHRVRVPDDDDFRDRRAP